MPDANLPRWRVAAVSRRPDGRIAYPGIVQYQLTDGKVVDLPPMDGTVYRIEVRNFAAYDRLRHHNALEIGHRLPAALPVIDNRAAPGA